MNKEFLSPSMESGWTSSLFERAWAPFGELLEDATGATTDAGVALVEVLFQGNSTSQARQDKLRENVTIPCLHDGDKGCDDMDICLKPSYGQLEPLRRVLRPFKELLDDAGVEAPLAICMATAPSASLVLGGKIAVSLCGLSLHTKAVYAVLGAVMAGGTIHLWRRYPTEADRTVPRRSAVALAICGSFHLLMASGYGLPSSLTAHLANPELVQHFLADVFVMPLVVANVGYLAGQRAENMRSTLLFTTAATLSFAGAAAATSHSLPMLALGALTLGKVSYDLDNVLPIRARLISEENKTRVKIITDLLVVSWSGGAMVEGLGLLGSMSLTTQLHTLAVLDALSKLGTCHLMLNPRGATAFRNAVEVLSERAGFP